MMDLIVSWLLSGIAEAFEAAVGLFSSLFGYDIKIFNDTFSYAATAYDIIRKVGLSLALILAAWQVIVFFTRGAEKAPSTPIRAALNAVIAVGFIYYGNYLFEAILNFCQSPYDALLSADAVQWGTNWGGVINALIKDKFAGSSMILMLIITIMIVTSFVKLLLEIVERYVVTFVLVYLSPLASSTLASSTTSGIYKKYFTMFISQCLLLFLNAWCLKMACSALSTSNNDNSVVISLIICYAFLRVSAKMDSYINQLGLNAAITGGGLGAEIFATGQTLLGNHGGSGNGAGGSGNKILGAAKTAHTWANRYNPIAAVVKAGTDTVVGAAKGGSEAFRSGGKFGERIKKTAHGAASGAGSGLKNSDNLISNTVGKINTSEKTPAVNSKTGKVKMVATGNLDHVGYHTSMNQQLVDDPKLPDGSDDIAAYNANIETWSNNEHLAASGFNYVKSSSETVDAPEKVAAIAKGLGIDSVSNEAADFIAVGFGAKSGVATRKFTLDKDGISGEYSSTDGYEHKWSVKDRSQYDRLTTQQKEGYSKKQCTDGKAYFVKTSKHKVGDVPKVKKEASSEQPTTDATNPQDSSEQA